jgi:hypothetical protein
VQATNTEDHPTGSYLLARDAAYTFHSALASFTCSDVDLSIDLARSLNGPIQQIPLYFA